MRIKREYRTVSRSSYDDFCKRHSNINLSYKKWKQIINVCNRMFIQQALQTGKPVKLPAGLGVLAVHKWEAKNFKIDKTSGEKIITLPVDWQKSRQEGRKIYNFNFHTSSFSFKWKWFPKMARITETAVWVFKPCREASRMITKFVSDSYYVQLYQEYTKGVVKMFIR